MIDQLLALKPATMLDLVPAEVYADVAGTPYAWAPEQHAWYYAVAKLFQPKSILEIGVLHGQSLIAMLLGAGDSCFGMGWDFQAYDSTSNMKAVRNAELCGVSDRFGITLKDSQKLNTIPNRFDLIHVDGDHSFEGAMHDLNLAKAATNLILFDDIKSQPECRRAADTFLAENKDIIKASYELPTQTGLLLIQLK